MPTTRREAMFAMVGTLFGASAVGCYFLSECSPLGTLEEPKGGKQTSLGSSGIGYSREICMTCCPPHGTIV